MKYAVLSDIHGNLDALDEVISDIKRKGIAEIICLGDMIGYGSQPDEVIDRVQEHAILAIYGNHELAVIDPKKLDWFNPSARKSILKTIPLLGNAALTFIHGLKPYLRMDGFHFVHGYPPDSSLTYLFQVSEADLSRTFMEMDFKICFIGHTHDLEVITLNRDGLSRSDFPAGKTVLDRSGRYMLNIGSVGQPRDGSADAKYIIWDPEAFTVELRCIAYDYRSTARKIIAAGFPEVHARRLFPR